MKKNILFVTVISILLLAGCASVPIVSNTESDLAKRFIAPSLDKAGIYIYRKDTFFGAALKKNVWIDNECIGETARGVYFYHEVDGGKDHTISTESEFSPNDLVIYMKSGRLYFVKQFIKLGILIGGAGLEQIDEEIGMQEVFELDMAKKGICNGRLHLL